ncbi:T9SS type A sorting domain-containing protein [Cecembia rubra]|uniref:Uncharacterized protein n=1 Tax=Cecembia rubra TaxID=1485585 RepID=A0A2P8E4P4_9BACT|nr:T9SS type A sorting domain-containing protein [Cecembia rubra]PSL04434.1 hypothetical protein CLV48_105178 [Cecembia rubra]
MRRIILSRHLFTFLFFLFINILAIAQTLREPVGCGDCENTARTYTENGGTNISSPHAVGTQQNRWGGQSPGVSTTVKFENRPSSNIRSFYRWQAGGNDSIRIAGIIVEPNVTLEIGRQNNNERPAFDIIGGCIIVKSGAVLNFSYYTKMQGLRICVEEGGRINFDSEAAGGSDGQRDNFIFNDIEINLAGPGAEITFGNAEIVQLGFIVIGGYQGQGCIQNSNGTLSPPARPPANIDVDLSRMTQAELVLFCNFLSNAGFSIQPVEYLYFKSNFLPQHRAVQLIWATAKEWENSHFEIQRSVNGVRNWEKIGEMKGAGWSEMPVEYLFKDEMLPLTGGNVFYRLKQVDFNGDFAYSEVVSARIPTLQFTNGVWRVFPNPSNGDALRIELLDRKLYNGEALTANLITPAAGRRSLLGIDSDTIAEEVLELLNANGKGVYILEIAWSNNIEHIKILKQ